MTVTTRFAPSPTGALHIGGARTALFNYLFARAQGGRFLLRIEDTDPARSTAEAVRDILDGLDWLGLTPDAEPVFQSKHSASHIATAQKLIARAQAFHCHMTETEIQAERAACHQQGRAFRSSWRDRTPTQARSGAQSVVRLRAPDAGHVTICDAVRGEVSVRCADIDDMVLVRADGTPTYMLAVVVDDHHGQITHVIRGDDHLTNAVRQAALCDAVGWSRPVYAHLPLIHGTDGKKLSKRHGTQSLTAYRDMGYLPDGVLNYLLLLGFSHGDQDIFTPKQAIDCFTLEGIGRSPARLDHARLDAINAHHLRALSDQELVDALDARRTMTDTERTRIGLAVPEIKTRVSTLAGLAAATGYLRQVRPLVLEPADRAVVEAVGGQTLTALVEAIKTSQWVEKDISEALPEACSAVGVRMGRVGPALRLCLSGARSASGLAAILFWLGRDEALARIGDQML